MTALTPITFPQMRFAGWLKPGIAGPEKDKDREPPMPKVHFPELERELEGYRFPFGCPKPGVPGPEIAPTLPDLVPMTLPEIVLPLPTDVHIKQGAEMHVILPDTGEELHYRLNLLG